MRVLRVGLLSVHLFLEPKLIFKRSMVNSADQPCRRRSNSPPRRRRRWFGERRCCRTVPRRLRSVLVPGRGVGPGSSDTCFLW